MKEQTVLIEKEKMLPDIEKGMAKNFVKELGKALGKKVEYNSIQWTAEGLIVNYSVET